MVSFHSFVLITGSLLFLNTIETHASDSIQTVREASFIRQLDSLQRADPISSGASVGIMIYDLKAGSTLYACNASMPFTPASNLKLLVAAAAFQNLDTSYVFRTSLYYTGNIRRHRLKGNLFLKGGGDPEFSTTDMEGMIQDIKDLGITKIKGGIYTDTSMIATSPWGKGWSWDDIPYNFLPRLSALVVNKGLLTSHTDSMVWSKQLPHQPGDTKTPEFSGYLFAGLLEHNLVKWHGSKPLFQRTPINALLISTRERTFREVLIPMMKLSDNLNAEMILFALGHISDGQASTTEAGLNRIREMLSQWGFTPESYRLADGSGLSFYNAVSPAQIVTALQYLYRNPAHYSLLKKALPRAAVDGSLKSRMKDTPAAGVVYAKTGTLTGVSCLSGYVERTDGRVLCFSIMIRGYSGSSASAVTFQDKICQILASP